MPRLGQETDVIKRLKRKTRYEGDCWIWTGKTVGRGYGEIWYKGAMFRINRLIAHLYHGMILHSTISQGNHKPECKSKACWNPDHIYVGTQYDNVQDQIKSNNFHYGTENLNGGSNFDKKNYLEKKREKINAHNE